MFFAVDNCSVTISLKADIFPDDQEIFRFLCVSQFNCHIYKIPPLDPVQSQLNSFHSNDRKFNFNPLDNFGFGKYCLMN